MAQAVVNFRMEKNIKDKMEDICDELGITMTTAFTIFAKKMVREKRIPFEVSVDPFYSKENIAYLKRLKKQEENGTAKFEKHDLIEDDSN